MIREDIAGLFRLAATETRERIRQDRERLPERFAPLFVVIEERLFETGFGVQAARRQSGIGPTTPPLGQPLAAYLDEQRIQTARRMLELGNDRIPTGRIAAAVGFASYLTWRRTFQRCTGETPPLIRLPVRVDLAFDDVTWHRACQGELSLDDARTLLGRLRRFYPNALEGVPPAARFLCLDELVPKAAHRCGGISDVEARVALERAAAKPLARLRSDAEGLPRELALVLGDVAENLFDPNLGVDVCRCRVGVRDTSISTKIRFYIGDTLSAVIEKRRIEAAMALVADRRFTIDGVAETVGMSYRCFNRIFRLRTGTNPSSVRETLRKTSERPAYELWCRAESERLSRGEVRALVAYLRGLQQETPDDTLVLAIRTDIDPTHIDEILELEEAVLRGSRASRTLDVVLRTHPEYSAAHWYSHWIRDRLGHTSAVPSWTEWQTANHNLSKLLRHPHEQRSQLVREDRTFQTNAFLWLLVDCVGVRLFHDAVESEQFADLAVAATEARRFWDRGPESAGLRGLALALKANAIQRRNELTESSEWFKEAFSAIRSPEVEPWVTGRIHSLHATLLERRGKTNQARRCLLLAGALMKEASDDLERLRCVIQRTGTWFSAAKDPTPLLTACIARLDRFYPFASDLHQSAHVNRILSGVYLADRLTGRHLAEIKRFRLMMPPPSSSFAVVNRQNVDGLLAALSGDHELAMEKLITAASWFEEHHFPSYAAIAWLQFSWVSLGVDRPAAYRAANTAYAYLENSGFKGHGLERIALKISEDARQHSLDRDRLRYAILMNVCPRLESRLVKPAGIP